MVVPCEYQGRARAFINKVGVSDERFAGRCDAIISNLSNRMIRKPTFRRAECVDLHRLWQTSETCFGRVARSGLIYDKTRVEFVGVRLRNSVVGTSIGMRMPTNWQ